MEDQIKQAAAALGIAGQKFAEAVDNDLPNTAIFALWRRPENDSTVNMSGAIAGPRDELVAMLAELITRNPGMVEILETAIRFAGAEALADRMRDYEDCDCPRCTERRNNIRNNVNIN